MRRRSHVFDCIEAARPASRLAAFPLAASPPCRLGTFRLATFRLATSPPSRLSV
jgi:hypothetical protein